MIVIQRSDSDHPDFRKLVQQLDADLKIRDGEDAPFFAQFNKIDAIKYVAVAYDNHQAVGCGAIKEYSDGVMEVKRMFVLPEKRGQGIASAVLKELEKWSKELHFNKCILETGTKQPEAIALYKKNNYRQIPNYAQYENVATSVCFEKELH